MVTTDEAGKSWSIPSSSSLLDPSSVPPYHRSRGVAISKCYGRHQLIWWLWWLRNRWWYPSTFFSYCCWRRCITNSSNRRRRRRWRRRRRCMRSYCVSTCWQLLLLLLLFLLLLDYHLETTTTSSSCVFTVSDVNRVLPYHRWGWLIHSLVINIKWHAWNKWR